MENNFNDRTRASVSENETSSSSESLISPSISLDPQIEKQEEEASEVKASEGGNGIRIFGILALAIYFIWGQGTACGWWMWLVLGALVVLWFNNKAKILQGIIGLFLIGITFFAPPTFGYSQRQFEEYKAGWSDGNSYYRMECIDCDWEWAWEQKQERASVDISGWKRFYKRGYNRGYSGKDS